MKIKIISGEKILAGPFQLFSYPHIGGFEPTAPQNPCEALIFKTRSRAGVKFAASGRLPKNSARRENERTWTTGDVIEFFIQAAGRDDYYEFHATPEGFGLQLHIPHYKLLRKIPFENVIRECGLEVKTTELTDDLWVGEMSVPIAEFKKGAFKFCVSRYYYANTRDIEFSSYPPLPAPQGYHNPPKWVFAGA